MRRQSLGPPAAVLLPARDEAGPTHVDQDAEKRGGVHRPETWGVWP